MKNSTPTSELETASISALEYGSAPSSSTPGFGFEHRRALIFAPTHNPTAIIAASSNQRDYLAGALLLHHGEGASYSLLALPSVRNVS